MKKLNKKGFTLVELLAVIVILALLMVVLATTALPAMNNAKKRTFILYVQRLQSKGQEMYMVEGKTSDTSYTVEYLMGAADAEGYEGSVKVVPNESGGFTVSPDGILADTKNKLCITSADSVTITQNLGVDAVKTYTPGKAAEGTPGTAGYVAAVAAKCE